MDGLLIQTKAPSKRQVQNQSRFWSGSKKNFGVNMQCVCDADCMIIAMSCKTTGSTNDIVAFELSNLKALAESLVFPYHWNADAAYICTETVIVPYPGVNLYITDPSKESFNFWHSQIRITIERCFGILVRRWGILWSPLEFSLDNIFAVIHACCRLHNFCTQLNISLLDVHDVSGLLTVDANGALLNPSWTHGAEGFTPSASASTGSTLRDHLLNTIRQQDYQHCRSHRA